MKKAARRGIASGAAALMLSAGAVAMAAPQAAAAEACTVSYKVNTWSGGFTATLSVTNLGDALKNWTLEWDFPGDQKVTGSWNTHVAQTGRHVALRNVAHNASLAKGATVTPGVQGTHSGAVTMPTAFKLNGRTCAVVPSSAAPAVRSADARAAAERAADRVDNPYQGAKVYVNPDWAAKASAEPGGDRVADQPTGVWMDRRAAITGTNGARGLREHLDTALQQGANLVQVVIYNLPGRDCAALASNGELGPDDLDVYQTEFIDPIAEIFQDPKYADLRIVTVVEIDSLPNLITNVSPRPTATENCNRMKENGNYQKGIAYALRTFGAIPNVYNYIDIGHHGWLGWDDNFQPTVDLLAQVARDSGSMANVHGFITNTANYGALTEPYFSINDTVNGRSVRESTWVDWNRYVDELSYAQAMRRALAQAGFGDGTGMLIDTSRNGWGGSDRPTGPGPQTDVDAYVDGGRLDRRIHPGNWCNQAGAGLGERPTAAPASGIDAYVWMKPPGESDGSSTEIPNDEGKGFDRMCDPTYEGNERNNFNRSGALPDAPLSGHWFSAQFQELMRNAYPPLS